MMTFLAGGTDAEIHLHAAFPNLPTFIAAFNTRESSSEELTEDILALYSHCGAPADFWRVSPVLRLLEDS